MRRKSCSCITLKRQRDLPSVAYKISDKEKDDKITHSRFPCQKGSSLSLPLHAFLVNNISHPLHGLLLTRRKRIWLKELVPFNWHISKVLMSYKPLGVMLSCGDNFCCMACLFGYLYTNSHPHDPGLQCDFIVCVKCRVLLHTDIVVIRCNLITCYASLPLSCQLHYSRPYRAYHHATM